MQTGEPNWAAVDGEAEMDYGTRPGLLPDLGPKIASSLNEDPVLEDPNIDSSDPAVRNFLNSLPSNGPYRIMITNLPQNITKDSLESELSTKYKITATIDYKPGQHYCFLKFNNRTHCLESTSLFGVRIHGAAIRLKVNQRDQQAEIRRANTSRNNSGPRGTLSGSRGSTGGRFKNLARDGTSSRETKKHRAPVGGSIRKKRQNRNNQSSSHSKAPTNPWNSDSRTQPKKSEKAESDYKIMSRGNKPAMNNNRFQRNAAPSGASSVPSRQRDVAPRGGRDNFRDRRNDRRDDSDFRRNDRSNDRSNDRGRDNDAFAFRNRSDRADRGTERGRKLREDDGRADDSFNWRRGTNNTPARPRMDRRDPARDTSASDTDFSRRAVNSTTTQRKTQAQKQKEPEQKKSKVANRFDLFLQEDDD